MDLQSIVQFINSVGFPIVCCTALFCQNNKQDDQHEKEITELKNAIENKQDEQQDKAMSELKNAVENNTEILHEISTKIDDIKEN